MKKDNLLKLLGIAFVVAILSTGVFYGLFVNKLSSNTGGRTMVIAAKPLKPGTVLESADVKTIPWASEQFPKGTYQSASQIIGTTVFDPIDEGEPVISARLATTRSGGDAGVPSGLRAVSVHVTDSAGVVALLRAGQKVDVQVVIGRGGLTGVEPAVRTMLENLQVLSVIPQLEPSSQGQNLPVVTLLAKPGDADMLALADSGARVRLTLRNPLDNDMRTRARLPLGAVMRSSDERP